MASSYEHAMSHFVTRTGWMRAAVLGANDGIVSTASLIVGVAAAGATQRDMMVAGVAGLVGGAMSMAAGEYVSVSTQSDSETTDIAREERSSSSTRNLSTRNWRTSMSHAVSSPDSHAKSLPN